MPSVNNLGREPIWRFAPESHFDELGSTQDSAARVNHLISVLPAGARVGKVHKFQGQNLSSSPRSSGRCADLPYSLLD
jgi:hypothetical protein